MRARSYLLVLAASLAIACEDGPTSDFQPFNNDIDSHPAPEKLPSWTPEIGSRFDDAHGTGDAGDSARFCGEAEVTALLTRMTTSPIIPDISVGGIPLWGADDAAIRVDDLLGRPEDGKFCQPTASETDVATGTGMFAWGPNQEVMVNYNLSTRLIDQVVAYQSYLGGLSGTYSSGAIKKHVTIVPRDRLVVDGVSLAPTVDVEGNPTTRPWLEPANLNKIYRMVRETFFRAQPFTPGFNCIATQVCDVIYSSQDPTTPQNVTIAIQDSGIQIRIAPTGHVLYVIVNPVRVAEFETAGTISFNEGRGFDPSYTSTLSPGCALTLADAPTFATFKKTCIDTTTSRRMRYNTYPSRDAVEVSFNGITVGFMHTPSTEEPVLEDGQAPYDNDKLFYVEFNRNLNATVAEFKPRTLATAYRAKLKRKLEQAAGEALRTHPRRLRFGDPDARRANHVRSRQADAHRQARRYRRIKLGQ